MDYVPLGVVAVDQTPIRGSSRSMPVTYTGLLDPICKEFAKANGVKPALFTRWDGSRAWLGSNPSSAHGSVRSGSSARGY